VILIPTAPMSAAAAIASIPTVIARFFVWFISCLFLYSVLLLFTD
jgi:hypothetical protein